MGFIRETHVTNSLHFEFTLAFLQLESFRVLTSSVQYKYSSVCQSCPTLCNPMVCSTPDFPVNYHLQELAQTQVHRVSDAIQPSHPLSFPSPFAFNLSQHQGFSNELVLHIRWPKYWSFSFSISPSNEHPGLISFRMDWLDLLAVQGTLKSLLQHHTFKGTVLQCSAFFIFHTYICIHIANSPPCTAETNTTL